MARKCFISFKTEDAFYKKAIQENPKIDIIDKSLNEAIDSTDEDYIMRKIREDYLSDTTVTIHLIGSNSSEDKGYEEQKFIKRELQASLFNGENNTKNGILGVILPSVYNNVFTGPYSCGKCKGSHNGVNINGTTVKEFSYNYYIPNDKCAHSEEDRYCVVVKWDDFIVNPEKYIEQAFQKRNEPISDKTKVRPE